MKLQIPGQTMHFTHEGKLIDANPSDEKLREMIVEKDQEIERLKAQCEQQIMLIYNTESLLVKENRELRAKLEAAEKHLEIISGQEQLNAPVLFEAMRDAWRYRKLKRLAYSANQSNIKAVVIQWKIEVPSLSPDFDQATDALPEIPHEQETGTAN